MPGQSSERELVSGCLAGKRHTQHQVYERFAPRMLALCARYIREDFEAEEVMISGFLKVFSKISQFKSEGSFEGWIRRIMVNECLNHLRKKKRIYTEMDLQNVSDFVDYNQYENEVEAEMLLNCINQLPDGYRTVFNLYAIEGYSHKEVSEMLGISENTSKSQLSRARAWLQKLVMERKKNLINCPHNS
ncbi:MAG: sigma-70 family RNA polymerase sigma factor [Bacteroidia bacterium]|nr:sigma-70 family RNA polymerase sigma factor [Bacteroidia bacterium]